MIKFRLKLDHLFHLFIVLYSFPFHRKLIIVWKQMSKYDRLGLRRGRRDGPLRAEWVRTLALDWKRRNCWRTPTRPSMAPWGVGRGAAGSLTDRGGARRGE